MIPKAVVQFLTLAPLFLSLGHATSQTKYFHDSPSLFSLENNYNFNVPFANYRLNLTVIPLLYNLRMRPVLHDGFPGFHRFTAPSEVIIRVESITNGSANAITMHQRNLEIDLKRVKVINTNTGENLTVSSQAFETERDLYTITLVDSFSFGDILEIYIPYNVNISQTENVGIYLGHYVDPDTNETRYLSATKLEPYHARKVLPLFDEPSLKAKWKIIVGRVNDGKYHSLSNMEIERTEEDLEYSGWVWDHYEESILMSPYLICMIVSDFYNATIEDLIENRTISTWAPKHDILDDGGSYGAITGFKILDFFEKKFKMRYSLRKLDAVALPQFASGAMEQWGLVTYRHAYLVWIPGENTEAERRKITQVLSHEISHQWYGNLVTCAWWSEIWLNEGFARYLQFWGMRETIPEFKVDEAYVNDVNQLALVFDQGPLTHPVVNNADSPNESAAVFDRISYEKGASLLKMMEGFLTPKIFEAGVIDVYLQRMQWKSAYTDDLFEALQYAVEMHNATDLLPTGTTLKDIMAPWTSTSGFPLIRVNAIDNITISISQEKFTLNSPTKTISDQNTSYNLWWVPVKVIPSETPNFAQKLPDLWLNPETSSVLYTHADINTEKWLMINPDATGYYRVLYDSVLTNLIQRQLLTDHSVISSSSRSQFIDDYFNLALGEYIGIETALELTKYLRNESASNVWTTVLTHLKPIYSRFTQDSEASAAFKTNILPHLKGALDIIRHRQSSDERGINVTLRVQLLDMACQLQMESCIGYAQELMKEWEEHPQINPFPVDLRPQLYCAAVKSASSSSSTWNFLLNKLRETRKDTLKTPLLQALSCSRDPTVLSNLLELALDSQSPNGLAQHISQILSFVVANLEGRNLVYDFVSRNVIASTISPELFASTVSSLSAFWNKQDDMHKLQQFIESNPDTLEPVRESLDASLRNIGATMTWWSVFGTRIKGWLEAQI